MKITDSDELDMTLLAALTTICQQALDGYISASEAATRVHRAQELGRLELLRRRGATNKKEQFETAFII